MTKIGVVIPCYMGGDITLKLISDILNYADTIVLVDDKCPLHTGKKVKESNINSKVHIIFNEKNMGVGGSTKKGFEWLLEKDCQIIIKMDADYQMNPSDIPKMCKPILKNECDSTKGNRFTNFEKLIKMPKIRLIGNVFLSYLTKFSTGYWEIFDPTNPVPTPSNPGSPTTTPWLPLDGTYPGLDNFDGFTTLNDLPAGLYRYTIRTGETCPNPVDTAFNYLRDVISVDDDNTLVITDGPYVDPKLCEGLPGLLILDAVNNTW